MLQIKDLKVCSLDLNFHEVSWALEDTAEDVFDYTFQIFRSESAMGPFEPVSVPFQDRYIFVDNIIQIAHRWRIYFYNVRVTHKASGESKDFGPASKEPPADLYALEIRRHVNLLFREHAGRRCWLLPVRTFGQRCECWDSYKQKRTRSGCKLCFDTGFVRGYMHPIEIWGQIDPSPKTEQNTNVGSQQQANTTSRFGAFPPIKPRDVIIEAENLRWRVVQVNQTEKARARIHQELQIHRIPEKDIEFAIQLDFKGTPLRDLAITPERNFTNPSTLADFQQKNMPDIFSLYTDPYTRT